jgi:hypothetical protein
MSTDARRELVALLERKAFAPVLQARPDGHDRTKLEHVQKATRAEIDRFRSYGSAEEVVTNFRRDLSSAPAKKVHAELRSLGLPTLDDLREEFERKARDLGVGGQA